MSLIVDDIYLTNLIEGRSIVSRRPVNAATTANITLSGTQTIDGVAVVAGNRVLVKNQTDSKQNGIYEVSSSSWSRTLDFNTGQQAAGIHVFILAGTTNGKQLFQCNNTLSSSIVGTDTLTFNLYLDTTAIQTITNKTFDDSTTYFVNSTDQTKRIKFDLSNIPTNTTKNYTFVNLNATLVGENATQTLTSMGFNDELSFISDDGDNTKIAKFEISGITSASTRTAAIPNGNGTLVTLDGVQTLTNKTLLAPVIDTIIDDNGNSMLKITNTGSGNDIDINIFNGGASGPIIQPKLLSSAVAGTKSNMYLTAKGKEAIKLEAGTGNSASMRIFNGSNYVELKAPDSLSSNITMVLPKSYPATKQSLKVQGLSGVLEFSLDRLTFTLSNTTNIVTTTPTILATTCFPWINTFYGTGGSLRLEDGYCTFIYRATAPAFGRNLLVEIVDLFSGTVFGTSTTTLNTVTHTAVRFQFTLPTADSSLQMRISADGSGGSINIYGGSLDFGKN